MNITSRNDVRHHFLIRIRPTWSSIMNLAFFNLPFMNIRKPLLFFIAFSSILFLGCDPCLNLPACAQYECRNPEFYCAGTLYESDIQPKDIPTAQKIVKDYIASVNKPGGIGLTSQSGSPYYWFNVTVNFDDGSTYGYEVGPDGNIYEIKRRN